MQWKIDSRKPCGAVGLRAELKEVDAQALAVVVKAQRMLDGTDPPARHAVIDAQIAGAIDAVCAQAHAIDAPEKLFLATLQGHYDEDHHEALDRVAIYLDSVPQ